MRDWVSIRSRTWYRRAGWSFLGLLLAGHTAAGADFSGAEQAARHTAIENELERVQETIRLAGGWQEWQEAISACHEDILAQVERAEGRDREVFAGPDGSLFTTALTRFAMAHNAPAESGGPVDVRETSAYTAIVDLNRQLEHRGIHLIFVPIPQKEEVYPRAISAHAPEAPPLYPQRYLYMEALLQAGVEVIDLLPPIREARASSDIRLYPDTDLHWGNHAMGIGAREVAARLKRYAFVQEAASSPYTLAPYRFEERGPLVKYFLPEDEWTQYGNLAEEVQRVLLPGGQPYEYDHFADAPVLMIGDSFMMRSRSGGSWAARLAAEIGVPVTGHMENQKGAQSAPRILARKGAAFYKERRVVVWYVVGGMLSRTWFAQSLPE